MTTKETRRARLLLPAGARRAGRRGRGAVLYGTRAPAGKVAGGLSGRLGGRRAAKLAPLAKGEIAALDGRREPRQALPLAFERAGRRQG